MNNNPFNNFNNITPNMQNRNMMGYNASRFNNAYVQNPTFIPQQDFTNKKNMLHNNLKNNVKDEHIVEYIVHIDSRDRDIGAYKDPFHYVVHFNPASSRIYKEYNKDGTITENVLKGPPKPHILRAFKNVKYIKVDNVCLPRYKIIKKDIGDSYSGFETSTDESNLYDDRFIELRIDELKHTKVLATNSHAQDSFGLIYPDKLISSNFYFGAPFFMSKVYNDSQLGNISRLTISYYDSYGNPIRISSVDNNGENPNSDPYEDVITRDPDDLTNDATVSVDVSDLRHPLNKKTQNYISLRIGVVESQQNINTKFEN